MAHSDGTGHPTGGLKGSSDRGFGFVFATVFAIVALWPITADNPLRLWAILIAAAFLVTALFRPSLLRPANRLWTRFGHLLARIMNPLVMGLIFFAVVTPIGVVMRLLGKDFLRLRADPKAASYWIEREPPGPAPETMKDQF